MNKTRFFLVVILIVFATSLFVGINVKIVKATGTEWITNGGFETGDLTSWSNVEFVIGTIIIHSGTYAACTTIISYASLNQTLIIPTPVDSVSNASLWLYGMNDGMGSRSTMDITITYTDDSTSLTYHETSPEENEVWTEISFFSDLVTGKTIKSILIEVVLPAGFLLRIDDISIITSIITVNVVSSPELHGHFNMTVGTEQNLTALSYPSLAYDGTLIGKGNNYTEVQMAQYADEEWNASSEGVIGQNYAAIVIPPYYIYRSYLYFDTSTIPSWANITGANISINIESKQIATSNFNITIQKGDSGFPHIPLQLHDYVYDRYTGGDGGYLDTTGVGIGYKNISLNDVGISCIVKGGTSRFCLRSDHDINASVPSDPEYLMFFTTESSYPPLLYVSYQNVGTPIITYNTTTYTTPHSFSVDAGNYSFKCVDLSIGPFGNLTWEFNSWIITTATTNDTIANPTITLNITQSANLTMYYLPSYYLPAIPFTIPAYAPLLGKILDLMGCFGIIALSYSHIKNLKTGLRAFLITMFTAVVFFIVWYLMVSLEAYAV